MFNSIFQKPWWLEAVAPGTWSFVEIKDGERVVSKMPVCVKKTGGFTHIIQPMLTQTLGPVISYENVKDCNRLSFEKEIMSQLIEKIPKFDYFNQYFHYSISNWLPFYWKGFSQTTRYTYIIPDMTDVDRVWYDFRNGVKTDIKKAQNKVVVRDDLGLETFYKINSLTFIRQNRKIPYSYEFISRLDDACVKNNSRKIFFAQDSNENIHAVVYVVWDENSAYYLMGGGDPKLRNSGATSLLLWEAIKHSSCVTKTFDFEGSMIEPVENFFRGFGSKQTPYFSISKTNSRMLNIYNNTKKTIKDLIC